MSQPIFIVFKLSNNETSNLRKNLLRCVPDTEKEMALPCSGLNGGPWKYVYT